MRNRDLLMCIGLFVFVIMLVRAGVSLVTSSEEFTSKSKKEAEIVTCVLNGTPEATCIIMQKQQEVK